MGFNAGLTSVGFLFFKFIYAVVDDRGSKATVYWFPRSDSGGDDASIQERDARV